VGSEETDFDQVYRLKMDDTKMDVSDITIIASSDLEKRKELLYDIFLPLALRIAWGL